MIHPTAEVQSKNIGLGSKIWQYVVVLPGAKIGINCNINSHCFIENEVTIGNNSTIKSGVYLWDGLCIENNVFVGPNCTFTNDLRPKNKAYKKHIITKIKTGASLGANTSVLAGVTVGKYAMSGIGSVITKDVPDFALVYGNPAKIMNWLDENGNKLIENSDGTLNDKKGNKFKVVNEQLIPIK